MSHQHTFTWRDGQLPLDAVRQIRRVCHGWDVTSKLRRVGNDLRLTFTAEGRDGIRFAKEMFGGLVALEYAPEHRLFDIFEGLIRGTKPPVPPAIERLRQEIGR